MINILEKITSIKRNYYFNLMEQSLHESHKASLEGDHDRSVMMYHKYLYYKHKYIKSGGKL